ncbi:MAG: cation:proton antiporter [Pseudomonadota bacterium]
MSGTGLDPDTKTGRLQTIACDTTYRDWTLPMHQFAPILQDFVIFLAAAGILVPVLKRFSITPVLGFIVIGIAIGPNGLAQYAEALPWLDYITISDAHDIAVFAELGVVFLLFMIGLELSFARLNAMRGLVFGFGGVQVALTAVVIGLIAFYFGNSSQAAVLIGASLALSSTAIVMQLLVESKRLATPVGRASFSVLLFQDLAVVPILFLANTFGASQGGSVAAGLALALGEAVVVIALIVLIGRIVVRPLLHLVGGAKSRELFMAVVLFAIIGTAVFTEQAGLSLALGAFLAGLLLAETEYRHQIEVDVEPFKGLLLGLFFVSVGMSLDLSVLFADPVRILVCVVGLYALKSAIIYVLARLKGLPREVAAESALLLGQGGEFAFVILSVALALGIVEGPAVQFILVVTILSMMVTPFMATAARRLGARLTPAPSGDGVEALAPPEVDPDHLKGHVVIAGFGRVGQLLGDLLATQRIPFIALDLDIASVSKHRAEDRPVYFGNGNDPHILEKLGIDQASELVVTIDDHQAAEAIVTTAKERWPDLAIVVRARDRAHARRLLAKGATSIVVETIEASLDLAEVVFTRAGVGGDAARQIVADRRQLERAAITEQGA